MATGLIYPLPILYGAVGFGGYSLNFDFDQNKAPGSQDQTMKKVGWHFGGGLELPIGSAFKLTGDVRYVFLDYKFEELPGHGNLKNSDFFIITAGLLFNL